MARLVGLALKGTTTLVYDVQAAVSDRVFGALTVAGGPVVSPMRVVHELSTAGAYAAVRGGLDAGSRLAELVAVARVSARTAVAEAGAIADADGDADVVVVAGAGADADDVVVAGAGADADDVAGADADADADNPAATEPPRPSEPPRPTEPRSLTEHPRTHLALAMLNALHGDLLDDLDSPLTLTMALRHTRRDVALDREALAATYTQATGTLVVFLHGLAENDDSWAYRARERFGDAASTYGTLLERDLSVTALYVRYNTGLRISANGALLAAMLERLADAWPIPVERVVLVGHSMGGLVIHSALAVDGPWAELVSHTVTLGAPHLGAPLERAVTRFAHGVPRSATLRVMRQILRGRSAGIKDLRHGNLVHADWLGHDPDDPSNRRVDVRPHPAPRHHAIVSTVTKDPGHVVGALLGDLMVLPHSAGGLEIPDDQIFRVGGLHHLDLLNHPSVYAQILTWLR